MLNISNHQGDANSDRNEIPPHTCQNGCHQYIDKKQVLVRMWRKENPWALLVGTQTSEVIVGSSMEFPKKVKNGTALRPSDPTSGNK